MAWAFRARRFRSLCGIGRCLSMVIGTAAAGHADVCSRSLSRQSSISCHCDIDHIDQEQRRKRRSASSRGRLPPDGCHHRDDAWPISATARRHDWAVLRGVPQRWRDLADLGDARWHGAGYLYRGVSSHQYVVCVRVRGRHQQHDRQLGGA